MGRAGTKMTLSLPSTQRIMQLAFDSIDSGIDFIDLDDDLFIDCADACVKRNRSVYADCRSAKEARKVEAIVASEIVKEYCCRAKARKFQLNQLWRKSSPNIFNRIKAFVCNLISSKNEVI